MQPVPHRCPICHQAEMVITQMNCPHCQSQVKGQFALHRLNRLTSSQLQFIEIFLLNEGKINRVEQEMGLSYTAVRARLQEIVEALGGSPAGDEDHDQQPPAAAAGEERRAILARVSAGELTAAEAVSLLHGE